MMTLTSHLRKTKRRSIHSQRSQVMTRSSPTSQTTRSKRMARKQVREFSVFIFSYSHNRGPYIALQLRFVFSVTSCFHTYGTCSRKSVQLPLNPTPTRGRFAQRSIDCSESTRSCCEPHDFGLGPSTLGNAAHRFLVCCCVNCGRADALLVTTVLLS